MSVHVTHWCTTGNYEEGSSKDCPNCKRFKEGEARDPLLVEREKTHGSFVQNAEISQHLKFVFKTEIEKGHNDLSNQPKPAQHEALDMIALKLARLLSGQCNYKDHWLDIAGYAKLGAEACE